MAKIKIGIIGVGNISECHIAGYKCSPNAELYAFCDINEERLKEKGARHGITRLYTSAEEMCNALPELDAVSVCVWNCNHYECTMAALRAGKHVLCEKPLAMNEQQAIEMRDFAKAQGKLLMVGFVRRFMAETEELKRLTDEGYFGDMYYTKATYLRLNGNPGGWFSDILGLLLAGDGRPLRARAPAERKGILDPPAPAQRGGERSLLPQCAGKQLVRPVRGPDLPAGDHGAGKLRV